LIEEVVSNPQRASTIAAAAQKRALRDHSYRERARRILEVCLPEWRIEDTEPIIASDVGLHS
jgi:hypothetical protein